MVKKSLAVMVLLAAVVGLGFAQEQGFVIGARVIGAIPSYTRNSDFYIYDGWDYYYPDFEGKFGFGFAAQASYNFSDLLGAQAEVIYNSDDITVKTWGETVGTLKATSLLIPILLRVGATLGPGIQLTGIGGIYFTIPLGDAEFKSDYIGNFKDSWSGSLGAMLGGIVGYKLGPGTIFADLRYAFDFSDIEVDSIKTLKKSAVHIGVGYSFLIGGGF